MKEVEGKGEGECWEGREGERERERECQEERKSDRDGGREKRERERERAQLSSIFLRCVGRVCFERSQTPHQSFKAPPTCTSTAKGIAH